MLLVAFFLLFLLLVAVVDKDEETGNVVAFLFVCFAAYLIVKYILIPVGETTLKIFLILSALAPFLLFLFLGAIIGSIVERLVKNRKNKGER